MRRSKQIKRKRYYVYILECVDHSYYTGVTNNIKRRFRQHCSGQASCSYTACRLPVILKYYIEYSNILEAITREKQIKGWSRAKKEALFKHDWDSIKQLASNRLTKQLNRTRSDTCQTELVEG